MLLTDVTRVQRNKKWAGTRHVLFRHKRDFTHALQYGCFTLPDLPTALYYVRLGKPSAVAWVMHRAYDAY